MKNKKIFILLTVFVLLAWGCEKMNDRHDKYLLEGEIVYIGKVDSVKAFPGDERIVFRYWLGDPRAKTLDITWSNGKEKLTIPVAPHEAADSFEVQIGKNEKVLLEGNYTFKWVSSDGIGHSSIVFEKNANTYGARYRETITDHIVVDAQAVDDNVVITWGANTSDQETGISLQYKNRDGETILAHHAVDELLRPMTLANVDFSQRPQYQTKFLPVPEAIDTFYTDMAAIPFSATVNVALNKPVTASDILDPSNATQFPENAVDGNTASNSNRWVSTADGEHWLEIDLLGEYTINSFKTWNGSGGYNYPVDGLKLQAWVNDGWVDLVSVTGNTDPQFGRSFDPVTTSKVRYYTYNQVRLFQIAVYSIINY